MVGTPGKPVTRSSSMRFENGGRVGKALFQHQCAAKFEDHQQLIQAVVEGERQHADDNVVFDVPQVLMIELAAKTTLL